jgi:hypothetical protein
MLHRTPPASVRSLLFVVLLCSLRVMPAAGQNLNETPLAPGSVNSRGFGKLTMLPVDGTVHAPPLHVSNARFGKSPRNVVVVATEQASVYAFDADTFAQLWHVTMLGPGEVPSDDRSCGAGSRLRGITSTPALDRDAGPHGTIIVVAISEDRSGNQYQRLHALDLTTGTTIFSHPRTTEAELPGASHCRVAATTAADVTQGISANGSSNGIVWAVRNGGGIGVLEAFDASNPGHELYNSNEAGTRDQFSYAEFSTPTIANSKVYVGTPDGVAVFGLFSQEMASSRSMMVAAAAASGPAHVQSASGNDHFKTASASASFSSSVTATNAIAVLCAWKGTSQTLNSVTDTQGNTYTIVANPTTGTYGRAAMAYAIARSSAADTVSCNFSTAAMGKSIVVHEVSGVDTSLPLDGHRMTVRNAPGSGANAITSGSITTTAAGDYILGFTFNSSANQADWSAGTGFTMRQNLRLGSYTAASEDAIQSAPGPVAATFTATVAGFGEFITGILAFQPGLGAPPPEPTLTSIAVAPANASIAAGTVQQFTATGTYSDGSTRDLTGSASWSSSDTSVATIDSTGRASGVGAGSTTIQAAADGASGSTGLTVTVAPPISVTVSPATASVQAPSGARQFTATVTNDPQSGGVTWSLSGPGCSGVACGTLSAGSSASGAAITYTAPAAAPTPATVTLTARSASDNSRAHSANISISSSGAPTGSTFVESFGESSDLCWSGGPSSCDQVWVVARGSGQSIVASPGTPPAMAGSRSLRLAQTAGAGSYIYTAGTFPRIRSGTPSDLYFTLYVSSHALRVNGVTRLITASNSADGSAHAARVSFRYDGTNLQLQAAGSSSAANLNISLNAWHTVRLHLASGPNASYISVDGGAQSAFTENALDYQYVVVGAAAGQLDPMTYYVGSVHIDSELGGGPPPSMYIDFEAGADGAPVTLDVLTASTRCGNGRWTATTNPIAEMTISASAQRQLATPVTTCGRQYTDATGTRGLKYSVSETARYAAYNWSTTSSTASVGFFFKIATVSNSNWYSVFAITAGGSDFAMLHMHGGAMYLEAWAGITTAIPFSENTWYWVTMQYNAGATHHLQVYETNQWTLLGSASTPATGNHKPTGISIGRTGSSPPHPSAVWYFDQIVVDYVKGGFPILQGAPATPATLESIEVTPSNPSIATGATLPFTATGRYSDGSTGNVTSSVSWSSSTPSVATIDSAGVASAAGPGTTTILASSGSVSGSTTLTVTSGTSGTPAYVQSASANDHYKTAAASARFAGDVTAEHAIAVFCGWSSLSQTLHSVTDTQGNIYTIVGNPTSGSYGRAAMAYAIARSSGPATVFCNFSTASMGKSIIVHEITGVDTSRPLDGYRMNVRLGPGGGANAVTSTNITTTANGDYLVGFTFNDSGNRASWTAGTGYTLRQDLQIASYTMASEDRIQATAGPVAATFTATAAGFGDFITGILAFQPRLATAPTPAPDAGSLSTAEALSISAATARGAMR